MPNIERFDAPTVRAFVTDLTKDVEPQEMSSPRRRFVQIVRGFKEINPDGMFLLSLTSRQDVHRKQYPRLVRRVGDMVLGRPWKHFDIVYHDIANPDRNRHIQATGTSETVLVVVGAEPPTAEVREPVQDDVDIINAAILTILHAGDRNE